MIQRTDFPLSCEKMLRSSQMRLRNLSCYYMCLHFHHRAHLACIHLLQVQHQVLLRPPLHMATSEKRHQTFQHCLVVEVCSLPRARRWISLVINYLEAHFPINLPSSFHLLLHLQVPLTDRGYDVWIFFLFSSFCYLIIITLETLLTTTAHYIMHPVLISYPSFICILLFFPSLVVFGQLFSNFSCICVTCGT